MVIKLCLIYLKDYFAIQKYNSVQRRQGA